MSATVRHGALGRGRRRGAVLAWIMAALLVLCALTGWWLWQSSTPPTEGAQRPVRRQAGNPLGDDLAPSSARVQTAPAPPSPAPRTAEPEPTPPPPAPPEPPPPPPLRLATMWGVPGLKASGDDARRGRSGGANTAAGGGEEQGGDVPGAQGEQSEFARRMQNTRYAPVQPAPVRLNPMFTVAGGTKINCVPDSPVSSETVGPIDCTVQGDVRSMDDRRTLVLIPDGTRVRAMVERGLSNGERRLFVIAQYATTPAPDHFRIPLDSPGADPMGQIGVPGDLYRRVWERYGPTLALSVIDFATGAATGLLRDAGGGFINFGSIGGQTGRTLGQMAFERDQNIPRVVTRGPARTLVIYMLRDLDLSRYYSLREAR